MGGIICNNTGKTNFEIEMQILLFNNNKQQFINVLIKNIKIIKKYIKKASE
ncbi:hypothetical protein [Candidatus Phytoplasma bonamiae]|uniref:Uncharacterized protein n=1 Tax=Candidatus Phytoplasma bonamiae TaxID=2982626 RepID=A0ABT9D7I6_9MOLU|nr:hypothetical protein ['Bonamia sp.' little leaf phytoplasma]MDO8064066.1 hypothetical protein ['Bonamia sp.' little leaf phytoplasma]MDV3174522.1 hypothetical protein ['Bonamia sp.' little leaf phytoplasma]